MSHVEENDISQGSRFGELFMAAVGLVLIPPLLVFAPRVVISGYREMYALSLNTAGNKSYFNENRRFDNSDTRRIEDLTGKLKASMDADDWTTVSALVGQVDKSREILSSTSARLADVVLDFIRYELAEAVFSPNMCNFDNYYEIFDPALARVEKASRAHPDDPILTALLAQVHIDRGWCARGGGWSGEVTQEGWQGLLNSFQTAEALLQRFEPRGLSSPLFSRVKFQLLVTADAENGLELGRNAYQDWSDMDTANPLPHRHFAFFSLPRWFGDWESFDEEARDAARRTRNASGKAAYAHFYLEAFEYEEGGAFKYLDTEFFAEALDDLIRHDPEPVVRALRVVVALRDLAAVEPITIIDEIVGRARHLKRQTLRPVIRHILETHVTHLTTKEGSKFDEEVLSVISESFQTELKAGMRLAFTPEGVRMVQPDA